MGWLLAIVAGGVAYLLAPSVLAYIMPKFASESVNTQKLIAAGIAGTVIVLVLHFTARILRKRLPA